MGKTIITCAITGGIHTPTMSDALPVTPEAIGKQALDAAEAGATILHLHARHPASGAPSGEVNVFQKQQMKLAAVAVQAGGHARVGLEDSLYIERGKFAISNAQQVQRVREILERQGNEVATPDKARTLLGFKSATQTGGQKTCV